MLDKVTTKIVRSNRRTLALHVLPDHTLVVKVPQFLPQREIDKFLDKYSGWIEKRLSQVKQIKKREYVDGEEFLFQGETLKLKIGDYQTIKIYNGHLLFPNFLVFRIKKELENWYINESKKTITELLETYSKEFHTSYKSVMFSDTNSKWGSCTRDNRLQFNWRLIMAPFLVIRYVVVHELAHTLEKNHSKNFWIKVASINPSYRQQVKWLKLNGNKLTL